MCGVLYDIQCMGCDVWWGVHCVAICVLCDVACAVCGVCCIVCDVWHVSYGVRCILRVVCRVACVACCV